MSIREPRIDLSRVDLMMVLPKKISKTGYPKWEIKGPFGSKIIFSSKLGRRRNHQRCNRKWPAHMNKPQTWHDWDTNIHTFPVSRTHFLPRLNWDVWTGLKLEHMISIRTSTNGTMACGTISDMERLVWFGAHIMGHAHGVFWNWGFRRKINPTKLSGHNMFFYPIDSTYFGIQIPETWREMPQWQFTMAGWHGQLSHQFPMAMGSPN